MHSLMMQKRRFCNYLILHLSLCVQVTLVCHQCHNQLRICWKCKCRRKDHEPSRKKKKIKHQSLHWNYDEKGAQI
uniref:Secreted protein n=1 Tax=Rhizophora mucronata TaxID=61149 RepID=A0A2P2JQK3_RHIMU